MKTVRFLVLLLGVAWQSFAQQPDNNEKKALKIPAIETDIKDSIPAAFEIKPESKFSIRNPEKSNSGNAPKNKITIKSPEKEFSMIDDNPLMQPGAIYEQRFNKVAVEQGLMIETMADVFLGDIRSNGEFVKIMCRDHEYPDGDLVQVIVNDVTIIPRLLLESGFKGFDIPLEVGINKIVFLALNQGESGPNTAEFIVYDDNQRLVSSKKWNLLTGVKATILVIKDEYPILEKGAQETNSKEE
ncbi:hypothetical protein ESY86_11685 [Subsaximicrobium wynnwilliamsii]|uniref:Uncharacterized protein n=1 Tax=Subsaximicrobium wynnwilliamsii TaxID=291179 RepID=A0A5C6ZF04_9FLAO|nr:hypothetical protein [Subsaximicrobium wynnwilliamsii]TXD82904.1 hypothetical protein ESY87_11720 [Subsaximicrobium wynnwilliamsii]TXD88626.1 hypothetical protein ESY86_11685 [Subsaximicrobium wynnwilliamsii]TXE02718.1 hypothetical protein ESY88_10740 [Subsaximicrobium wynnwilliamsii]